MASRVIGIPYLAPEIVLLYKAECPRPSDEGDFANVLGRLADEQRSWLFRAVATYNDGHPWLALP